MNVVKHLSVVLAAILAAGAASAQTCGLCATEVNLDSSLARCLLGQYPTLATRGNGNGVVVVDLTSCERERGVVEALPAPVGQAVPAEPDLQFMLSRAQLECLKGKIEKPGAVRDPLTRIDLGDCG